MKRLWLWLVLVVIIIVGLIAENRIAAMLHGEPLRRTIERELSEVMRLDVEIAGSLRVQLFPEIQIEIEDFRIANLPDRPSPHLLEVGRLALEIRILPLLRGMLVINGLEFSGATLHIEPDEEGAWGLRPDLDELDETPRSDEADAVALAIRRLEIHDLEIHVDRPSEEGTENISVKEFIIESEDLTGPLSFAGRGTFRGHNLVVEADTGSLRELLNPTVPFPISLGAWLWDGHFEASGTLGNPRTLAGLELRVQAKIEDVARGLRELNPDLPSLGPAVISGLIVDREGVIGIEALSAHSTDAGHNELDFEIDGAVRDLLRFEGVDLHMRVALPDVDLFKRLTTLSLPGVPLLAEFEMDDEDGSLGVEAKGEAARPGIFEFSAEGGFDDLLQLRGLDILVGFKTKTLDSLLSAFDRDPSWHAPDLGLLEASGHLILLDGRLGLDQIDVRLGDGDLLQAQLSGSVGDVLAFRDVELEARISAERASRVASRFGREIPEIGGLTASLFIRDKDGSLGVENATLEVGGGDAFKLNLSWTFDDLFDLEEVDFEATLEARDLALLGELVEVELPEVGPVVFSGDGRGSAASLTAHGRLNLNRTEIRGELVTEFPSLGRPTVKLRIESPLVHLPDLFVAPSLRESALESRIDDGFDVTEWWRGQQRNPLDRLRAVDADLHFEAQRVTGYEFLELEDFRILARLDDGHLVLDDFEATYEKGRVSGRLEIDARPSPPIASLELEAFNVDLTRLMSQFQASTGYAGLLDLSIQLETSGATVVEARSNLQGVFGAMLRDGVIVSEYSRALRFELIHVSIPSFFSQPEPEVEAPVHCLLAMLPINDGVAELETFYLEGQRITVMGEGRIDLVKNEFDLKLTPRLHDPGLVGVAATVKVTGPIGNPDIEPSTSSMLTSALASLYKNAIRPFSSIGRAILGGDRRNLDEIEDPCGQMTRRRITQMLTDEVETLEPRAALADAPDSTGTSTPSLPSLSDPIRETQR